MKLDTAVEKLGRSKKKKHLQLALFMSKFVIIIRLQCNESHNWLIFRTSTNIGETSIYI